MTQAQRGALPPIDFGALARALLDRAETLVSSWLAAGRRRGHEWVCGGLGGDAGESLSINLNTGLWADFATGDKGGDLISLYAAIQGLNNGQAAHRLMQELGWQRTPMQAPAPQAAGAGAPAEVKRKTTWRPVVPVPAHAPPPSFKHFSRELQDLAGSWEYRFEGRLYGYVARFRKSDGGKEVLPLTWCVDESDGQGTQRWHWMQWAAPRPLYVPATLLASDARLVPVVLVEGEKCAKAGFELLPAEFDWVSWPGGGNAWDKADWEWLRGRVVLLWPDVDAKRVPLTKAERDAGADPASKPLLPEVRQPGMKAMRAIAGRLHALGCTLLMAKVPRPGEVADGWDVADAIAGGWGPEEVRAFLRAATAYTPQAEGPDGISTPSGAAAGEVPDAPAKARRDPYWRDFLLSGRNGPLAVRENLVAALEGVRSAEGVWHPGVAAAAGVLAYNEFTNDVVKLRPAPWGAAAGLWGEAEELDLGEWLVRQHRLPPCARGTLEEAVAMVSRRHAYHPVRTYLDGLRWDGVPRLAWWLRRCCLEEDEWDDREPLQRYLARAGTWFIQGMVARVMQPGIKFDYMLILEGKQGLRKSTLLRTLAGDWFADTGILLGDKDSYQQLQGRWLYEFAELDSFGKAEVTKIKSFVASASDYFRASFDRRARDYPRQVVFGGTTNEDHYLTDPTGNRRFWPVRVTRTIDIEWLEGHRDQLFAEAMQRWREGARMHPTPEEEEKLFAPQQRLREVENAIAVAIATWLESDTGLLVSETTLVGILGKVGIGVEKLGPGRYHEKQAAAALRALGWTEGPRSSASVPGRPRKWLRPSGDDPYGFEPAVAPAAGQRAPRAHDSSEAPDDCPF